MGSQSSRWDKGCLIIWIKVKTQRDRFRLVWVPGRGVKKGLREEEGVSFDSIIER